MCFREIKPSSSQRNKPGGTLCCYLNVSGTLQIPSTVWHQTIERGGPSGTAVILIQPLCFFFGGDGTKTVTATPLTSLAFAAELARILCILQRGVY